MPQKVESYQSNDGKFHATEIAAVRHEVLLALWAAVPDLKDRKNLVESNIDLIAHILQPLGSHTPEPQGTHAEVRCRYAHPPGSRCPACADVPRDVTVIPAREGRARG